MADTARSGRAAQRVSGLLAYFVEHRTAANLLVVLVLLAGLYSISQIRSQFFPDVIFETITVTVRWSGVGPEEMDRSIVSRLEPKLRAVEGVDEIAAASREGQARVTMNFENGWDMSAALDDVRAVVDDITDLPEGADEPIIRRARFRDRVTDVVIIGNAPIPLLYDYAEELQGRLFARGATRTTIVGAGSPGVSVELAPATLERYQLSFDEIAQAIRTETGTQPVGDLGDGAARVRADVALESVRSISDVPLRYRPDGTRLTVGDVADVGEDALDSEVALFSRGLPALRLRVERNADGDAIEMQALVEQVVDEMSRTLPEGIELKLARTRSAAIKQRIELLTKNGVLGLVIVLMLLFLFLSARAAFWVALGIPVAMAASIALLYAFGFTLNMVSLFALIICLGIIVDDAIVVGEHADALNRRGLGPTASALGAAKRMAGPVLSASITTVIAFGALVLIGGGFGRLIADLPFTVCMVVLASLAECFLILPAHMRHAAASRDSFINVPSRLVNRGFDWLRDKSFRPLVEAIVRLRYPVWGLGFFVLMLSVAAILDNTVRWRFFVAPERGTVTANIAMLPGANRDDTRAMLEELDRALETVAARYEKEYGQNPVTLTVAKLGGTSGRGLAGGDTIEPDRLGGYDISLIDPDERPYSALDFIYEWRSEIDSPPNLQTLALRRERSGPSGDDIDVRLEGDDSQRLKEASLALQSQLSRFEAVSALEDNLAYDKPEYLIRLSPRGTALGFTIESVSRQLRQQLDGVEAATFARGAQEVAINVRLAEKFTGTGFLQRARVLNPSGTYVPLTAVAIITERQGFSVIRRDDGRRVVKVTGELVEDSAARDAVNAALRDEILPTIQADFGVSYTFGGLAKQEREFLSDAGRGIALCLAGIYIALAWVFASWTRPIVVMVVIPFGLVGAVWGHHLHEVPLSMFSVVGMIGMTGIIVNDSIVLITTIDERLRHQGTFRAVVDGTVDRLRAVLLTTLTTVGGLAPLLFEQSRQAAFLKPTVITLVYGLGFGMIIVLCLTPTTVAIQQDIRRHLASARRLLKLPFRSRPAPSES